MSDPDADLDDLQSEFGSGEISFSRAAELSEVDVWSFADLIRRKNISWVDEE